MLMVSAGCRSILSLQKMCSSTFTSLKTREKRGNSRRSSTLPLISLDNRCGSSSATAMSTRPVAAFASKLPRPVPSVRWGSDYGHRQKTAGAIQSRGQWDTPSINIVGPLPADHRQGVSSSCLWTATRGIPSPSAIATTPQNTVSKALLRHVVPYFGTPCWLLSD